MKLFRTVNNQPLTRLTDRYRHSLTKKQKKAVKRALQLARLRERRPR